MQFAILAYDPRNHLPTERSERAGHELVETLRQTPGAIWIPYHGYLATQAGKSPQAHWMAVSDVLISTRAGEVRIALQREVEDAILQQKYDLIVLSSRPFPDFPPITESYAEKGPALTDRRALWPLTGMPRRPEILYTPRTSGTDAVSP